MQQNPFPDLVIIGEPALSLMIETALRRVLSQQDLSRSTSDEFLDVEQAAQYVKMSVSALYAHTSKRKIPHLKRARRLFFRRAELDEWLLGGRRKTREEIVVEAGTSQKKGRN